MPQDGVGAVLDRLFRQATLDAAGRGANPPVLNQPPVNAGITPGGISSLEPVGSLPPTPPVETPPSNLDFLSHFKNVMNVPKQTPDFLSHFKSIMSDKVTASAQPVSTEPPDVSTHPGIGDILKRGIFPPEVEQLSKQAVQDIKAKVPILKKAGEITEQLSQTPGMELFGVPSFMTPALAPMFGLAAKKAIGKAVKGIPDSNLGKIQKMLETKVETPRDWNDIYLKLQEQANDITYGLRRMQTQIGKIEPIKAGSKLDIETAITRSPGAANAGLGRYEIAVSEMKRLAPDAKVTDINTILFAEHGKEVLAQKGAKRVLAGGVNTVAGLDDALNQLRVKLGDAVYQKVEAAAKVVKDLYASERIRLVDAGLINKKLADELASKYPWYNPMRYLDYVDEMTTKGQSAKPFSQWFSGVQRLSEVGSEKAIQSPIVQLSQELIRNEVRIQKNELATGIIDLALKDPKLGVSKMKITVPVAQREGALIFRPRHGEIPGTLSRMVNGTREVYSVPDWMYREAVLLQDLGHNSFIAAIGAVNGISRAAFTSVSPVFTIANMFNDMLPAFIRGGVLPTSTAKRLALSFKSLEHDPLMQAYKLSGAMQSRFYGKDAMQIAKEAGATGGKVIGKRVNIGQAIKDAIPSFGQRGEQASREAVFERLLNKTLPKWRTMTAEQIANTPEARKAAAAAVESTINFGRGGYFIKQANPVMMFLNANMEGMKLPFRTLRENPAARWKLGGIGVGVAGLTAYNMSYPEYMDVPSRVRHGSVVVMLPSTKTDLNGQPVPKYLTLVPNTREWAVFFGPITYGMEKIAQDSPEDFLAFAGALLPQVSPLGITPAPQALVEAAQQVANYDFYTRNPIISQGKENLPPTEQTGPYVSPAVEKGAQAVGLSPLRIQHALQALFGGAGAAVTSVLDFAVGVKNKRGLDLQTQYNELSKEKRTEWMAKLSGVDKSALKAVFSQAQQTIPLVSSVTQRFYHERGGQLLQNEWDTLDKTVSDTNQQFAALDKAKTLGIKLGTVGDSIDLKLGFRGGSVDLTPGERAEFQKMMADYVIPRMEVYMAGLSAEMPPEKQKERIQARMNELKDTIRAKYIQGYKSKRQK